MSDVSGDAALAVALDGLRQYWSAQLGHSPQRPPMLDMVLLDTLGLGNQQVLEKLNSERPDFESFRSWAFETAGPPDPLRLDRYAAWIEGRPMGRAAQAQLASIAAMPTVLDEGDLAHWEEHGYVVLRDAITAEEVEAVTALLWQLLGASPDDPESWHNAQTSGIMIPFFQHPALEAARQSHRIHKAFAQLWGSENLWCTIDRLGFNPPEAGGPAFRGAGLHWDVSLVRPVPFGTQAVLYLTDTQAHEGAFRCVPGFHRRIDGWLEALGDADPRTTDLSTKAKYVPGRAGDLIIWRQDLPHGASPNRGTRARLVQYLNYYSPDMLVQEEWA
jgi:hypothetical protein